MATTARRVAGASTWDPDAPAILDPNDPKSPPWYTTAEAGVALRLHPLTIMRYARARDIKAVKAGRSWRIERSELVRVLKEGLPPERHS